MPLEERDELILRDAREDRRVGDLVAVQVEDRQHGAVRLRVQELVRVPAGGQGPGLGLAVTDDAGDEEVGIVERGSVSVRQRVAELAALVDRARSLGRDVTRDASRERELPEELPQAVLVARHVGVDLGIRAFEVGVRDEARASVTRSRDVERAQVPRQDRAVEVRVDEVEPRRRPEVAEEARLDVLGVRAAPAGAGCRAGRFDRPRGSSPRASRRRSAAARRPATASFRLLSAGSGRHRPSLPLDLLA